MHTEAHPEKGRDAVRDYVALDRALARLESRSPERSAALRLQLNRARAAYLRGGATAEATYADTLAVLGAALATAVAEADGTLAPQVREVPDAAAPAAPTI